MMKRFIALALSLSSCCSSSYLTVQTDFLSQKNLASTYVGTPDPRQFNPAIGERLIISWSVPKKLLCELDLHLKVTIRFRNRTEVTEIFYIRKMRGTYLYSLLNNDYLTANGILSYKIDLISGDTIFEEWRHQMYAELIEIGQDLETKLNVDDESLDDTSHDEDYIEDYPIDWDE